METGNWKIKSAFGKSHFPISSFHFLLPGNRQSKIGNRKLHVTAVTAMSERSHILRTVDSPYSRVGATLLIVLRRAVGAPLLKTSFQGEHHASTNHSLR